MARHSSNAFGSVLGLLALCALLASPLAWGGGARAETKPDPMASADERGPGARVTKGEAMRAALATLPGKVTDVSVERKRGKQVYVIEIAAEKDGSETDVLVDMQTGAVLGIDR